MARIKPKATKVKTLDEVNTALADIVKCEIRLAEIDNKASTKIGELKERAAKEGEQYRKKIQSIGEGINLFADFHKDEIFLKKRSVELSYGTIGFRKSTKVKTKKTTLELLKKLFPKVGIITKESIDKNVLGEWEDEKLAQVDAAKAQEDNFFYETDKDEVNKQLMQAAS